MHFTTRFAPSPTGLLHRGHAFSALTAWTAAREARGRFLLRIEDTDFTRCRPEYEIALIEDLTWLGLDWDGPVVRQSERRAAYDAALERLRDMGVLYRCFRTRKELMALAGGAPHGDDPVDARAFTGGPLSADEEAALLAQGKAFAWRLSLAAALGRLGGFDALTWVEETADPGAKTARPETLGDMVVGRKDIGAGYVIASVVDDAAQGVTHVIRGEDLFDFTPVQVILQRLFGLPTPTYHHHRLIRDDQGKRLAKRDDARALSKFRAEGATPADIRRMVGLPKP